MSRMRRLAARGKRSRKSKRLGEPEVVSREEYAGMELDSRLELIRSLVPVGLMAVYQELDREVVSLAGRIADLSPRAGPASHLRAVWHQKICTV